MGCGPAASSGSGAPAGVTATKLEVTFHGITGTEWLASNGWWSTSYGSGAQQERIVYDGAHYINQFGPKIGLTRGIPGFVRAAAQPVVEEAPGIELYQAYKHHAPNSHGFKIATSHQGSSLVLDVTLPYDTDTETLHLKYHIVADAPVSIAQAMNEGAFTEPTGTPTSTETGSAPGAATDTVTPAYWFGPSLDGRTARITIQQNVNVEDPNTPADEAAGDTQYETVYRDPKLQNTQKPGPWAGYPGIGDIPGGDIHVINLSADAASEISAGVNETGRVETPVTLRDGTPATIITWNQGGASPGGGSFVIRTPKTTVEVNYIGDVSADEAQQLVATLRPVPNQ